MENQIKDVIEKAHASKHTDAILLLNEKKPELAGKVKSIVDASIPDDQEFKKAIAIVCEFVFNGCVEILSNDKKSDE